MSHKVRLAPIMMSDKALWDHLFSALLRIEQYSDQSRNPRECAFLAAEARTIVRELRARGTQLRFID